MVRDKILHKLNQHDLLFVKLDRRFEQVDKRFEQVDKRFEGIDKRLDVHELRLDRITDKLLEHDNRFDGLERYMAGEFSKVNETLEEIVTIVKRLDQERIFTTQWVKRIDDDVAEQKVIIREHDVVLGKVKAELNIV